MGLIERLRTTPARPVFLIGVGGIGVSGIARILHREGVPLLGSDQSPSPVTDELLRLGIPVRFGQRAENVPENAALVIASAAVPNQNPELCRARALGVPIMKYAEALGALMEGRRSVAVAGTHGKTTTTAMTSHLLIEAGYDPTMVVGGNIPLLGGTSRVGRSDVMVAEACEYDRSFLNLSPTFAVVTNVEEDHLDYYRDLGEIEEAFRAFGQRVAPRGAIICCAEDPRVPELFNGLGREVMTYAIEGDADLTAEGLELDGGEPRFTLVERGREIGPVTLAVPGRHNVLNALGSLAVASAMGVHMGVAREALGSFPGVNRRFHLLHDQDGVAVVDDYAHHPSEIEATLRAARERFPGRQLIAVFQPHQFSRTRHLLRDFARTLSAADACYVPDIYFARDSEADQKAVSASDLVQMLRAENTPAFHEPHFDALAHRVADQGCAHASYGGSLVLTMGAGNIYEVGWRVRDLLLAPADHASGSRGPRPRRAGPTRTGRRPPPPAPRQPGRPSGAGTT